MQHILCDSLARGWRGDGDGSRSRRWRLSQVPTEVLLQQDLRRPMPAEVFTKRRRLFEVLL